MRTQYTAWPPSRTPLAPPLPPLPLDSPRGLCSPCRPPKPVSKGRAGDVEGVAVAVLRCAREEGLCGDLSAGSRGPHVAVRRITGPLLPSCTLSAVSPPMLTSVGGKDSTVTSLAGLTGACMGDPAAVPAVTATVAAAVLLSCCVCAACPIEPPVGTSLARSCAPAKDAMSMLPPPCAPSSETTVMLTLTCSSAGGPCTVTATRTDV